MSQTYGLHATHRGRDCAGLDSLQGGEIRDWGVYVDPDTDAGDQSARRIGQASATKDIAKGTLCGIECRVVKAAVDVRTMARTVI